MSSRVLGMVTVSVVVLALACSQPRNNSSFTPDDSVAIVATDSGHVAPDTIPAGMTHVTFENRGSTIHEVMFVRLPEGMTGGAYAAAVAAGTDFPPGAVDCSGIGLTSPGEHAEAWLPLDPGNYILVCWFGDHAEVTPRSIVVSGEPAHPVQAPREDATIRLIDFRFEIIGEIRSGENVLNVETVGPSMHEMDIFRLADGKTVDDLRAWQKDDKRGPAPAVALGGVLDSHDISRRVLLKRSFEPGRHVLWCNMPMIQNAGENDPHVSHSDAGMVKEFEVTR